MNMFHSALPLCVLTVTAFALPGCPEDATSTTPTVEPDASVTPDVSTFVPLTPPPEGEGFQLTFNYTVEPASEAWICDIVTLPNPGAISNVNRVEVQQTPGTHHLTLSALGLVPGSSPFPPGRYPCEEIYGNQSLMEDQIMFFGNQGTAEDEMILPPGVAATLPGGIDIIYEMHYVNPTQEPVELYSIINAWTIPDAQVDDGIWGGSVRDEHINIPAGAASHTEWTRCAMNRDVEVLFLASHMHELGVEFTIRPWDGGAEAGDIMYSNDDWHVPQIVQYDPPLVVPKGQGFEFACTWKNPFDQMINYGSNATDEMCNLAVVFKPFDLGGLCEVVESSDGVLWTPSN